MLKITMTVVLIAVMAVLSHQYQSQIIGYYDQIQDWRQRLADKHAPPPEILWHQEVCRGYEALLSAEVAEALTHAETALAIAEHQIQDSGHYIASALKLRGLCYGHLGDNATAEHDLSRAAADADNEIYGGNQQSRSMLKSLADIYRAQGNQEMAEPLYLNLLSELLAVPDQEPKLASYTLLSLGHLYFEGKQYPKAHEYLESALRFMEKAMGPEHRDAAPILISLGNVNLAQQRHEKAESLLIRASLILESEHGPYDMKVIPPLASLALLYEDKKEYTAAVSAINRMIKIRETNAADPEGDPEPELVKQKQRLEAVLKLRRNH